MNTAGLSTALAPPPSVPLTFHAIAPLAMIALGAMLALEGGTLLLVAGHPRTIALVHVATLGVLLATMLGSLYQMVPVVLGQSVPALRLSYAVGSAIALGAAALVLGLWTGARAALLVGTVTLGAALLTFVAPVAIALARARAQAGASTLLGMRIALASLVALASLGLRLAWGHATGDMPAARATVLAAHVVLALVGWVGGLVTAVSWQVVPMFYLTAAFPPRRARAIALALAASMAVVFAAALAGASARWVAAAAAPGAVAVWIVQPLSIAALLRRRKRRRRDPTLSFWWLSIGSASLLLPLALASSLTELPSAGLLFGWVAIFGWAGAAVHGMQTRIIPFLVWLSRFAALVGAADVPPMKRLLPDEHARWQLFAHGAALAVGVAAIATRSDLLARATGALVVATGSLLGAEIVGVLYRARGSAAGRPAS